jgi:riboflavin kinase/FMN adenylyltransferase
MVDKKNTNQNSLDFFDLDPLPIENTCVTIGNFDGVHKGHQAIIHEMVAQGHKTSQAVVVVTFFPNPADYFNPDRNSFYLSTPREKEARLLDLGVDRVVTFTFNQGFANLSPEDFLFGLREKLNMQSLVVGYDFALGRGRLGTIPIIKQISDRLNFNVNVIEPRDVGGQAISSTLIRMRLDAGDMRAVREMLGRFYSVDGVVRHGSNRGSKIGLPTANIDHWPHKKLPAIGVYATRVRLRDCVYHGITNVGYRPTFEDQENPNIETHIMDFFGDAVGETLSVEFVQKIRDEQKFSGISDFLAQIKEDKMTAQRIFTHAEI